MSWITNLYRWLSPQPKDWGLRDNELDFTAQLVPNSPGIVAALSSAVELAPADIPVEGRPGMVVKIYGIVEAGPEGPLTAPLSGQRCAWYRSYVMTDRRRGYTPGGTTGPQSVPDIAPSDMLAMRHGGTTLRPKLRQQAEISTAPFRISDAGVALEFDPLVTDVDTDVLAANDPVSTNRVDRCLLVEWVLPLGKAVVVYGTLGPDLRLLPGPDTALVVTTKSDERLLGRHRTAVPRYAGRRRKLERIRRGRGRAVARAVQVAALALPVLVVIAGIVLFIVV